MAQTAEITDFSPLSVRGTGYGSLQELLAIEGDPFTATPAAQTFNATSQAVPISVGSLLVPPPGRAFYVQEFSVAAQTAMRGRIQSNPTSGVSGIGTPPYMDTSWASSGFNQYRLTINQFVRSASQYSGSSMSCIVSAFTDATPTATTVVASYTGFQLADDLNFGAAKTILVIGDSRQGSGPTVVDLHPGKVITNYYRSKGIDARYVLKAYSGSTTRGHDNLIKRGVYDGIRRIGLIVYDLGTNDAVQGYNPTTDTVANLTRAVQWKQRFHPTIPMLVLGSPPLQGTNEAVLQTIRAAEESYVDGQSDPLVLFFSFQNAFDRTVGANYLASDGVDGTRIHVTDPGLTQMFNGGYSGFIGLLPWLDANLPTI